MLGCTRVTLTGLPCGSVQLIWPLLIDGAQGLEIGLQLLPSFVAAGLIHRVLSRPGQRT